MYHVVLCHADDIFRGGYMTAVSKEGFYAHLPNCNIQVRQGQKRWHSYDFDCNCQNMEALSLDKFSDSHDWKGMHDD